MGDDYAARNLRSVSATSVWAVPVSRELARHLEWCVQRNLRPSYITVRRQNIQNLALFLDHPVESATAEELADWYAGLGVGKDARQPGSRAFMLSHVQNYFRWLVREGLRADDPTVRLMRPRLQRLIPRPILDEALETALEQAPERVRFWLLLAAYGGLRACEIAGLRAEDVRRDLDPPKLLIANGKGGKQRVVPLHAVVIEAMDSLELPRRGYLFAEWVPSAPPRPYHVSHWCNTYLKQVDAGATLHQLRHWFGTAVYRSSQDLRMTQELMGHADPRTTAGYAAFDDVASTDVVNGLRIRKG